MNANEPRPQTLQRRILAALVILFCAVGAAALVAGLAQQDMQRALDEAVSAERGIETTLRLSIALRDAYAHQAHVVILNDTSHVDHYGESFKSAQQALATAKKQLPTAEMPALEAIARVMRDLDRNFQERIVPLVPGSPGAFAEPHDRALHLLEEGQKHVDALTARLAQATTHARDRADAARDTASARMTVVLFAALLLALGVSVYLHRSVAGPLSALEAATRKLGQGDLGTRVDNGRDDELGALARRFNRMAEELEARDRKVREAERLAGIGKVAAGVAHEINNPLGVILGYARLVEKQGGAVADDAKAIVDEVERCRTIVAGLLDLSRAPRLALSPVALDEVVNDVAARLVAAGTPLQLRCEVEGDVVVEADEGKIRQITTNLLANAVEAAPGAPVDVTITDEGEAVRVSVVDRGPGIDQAVQARLFEPFFTTKKKGTGLGLAVSASLARAHGGALRLVDAHAPGARFDVVLPKKGRTPETAA